MWTMPGKDEKTRTDRPQDAEVRPTLTPPRPATFSPESQPGEAAARSEGPVGLEQIREILFGALFRELDRKVVRADAHMSTRSRDIEQEARRRTEVLETHLRTEIGALATRVEHAVTEAGDALRTVTREHRDAIGALEKRIAKAEEAGAVAQRELRNQMLEQAKAFLDQLQHLRSELLAAFQEEFAGPESERLEETGGIEERARH
jgi:hypothetical protein